MEIQFTAEEVRVLGSLMEKEVTTPEYYPLSLNALTNACNQKSSRDPVVAYDESTVAAAMDSLREKKHMAMVTTAGSRTPKFRQLFTENIGLDKPEAALLCVLMLRGPQTLGELRGRAERLFAFTDMAQAQATLDLLLHRDHPKLAVRLPRQAGRKEARFAHVLCGEIKSQETTATEVPGDRQATPQADDRLERLQRDVESLRAELEIIKQQIATSSNPPTVV